MVSKKEDMHPFIKGKSTNHPLKFTTIFNLTTDASIFTIDTPKVLISFNSGTFDFFFSKMPNHYSGHIGKKNFCWGHFGKKMLELIKIKTLGRSIVKIETSVAELKITANFRRVIRTFPFIKWCILEEEKKTSIFNINMSNYVNNYQFEHYTNCSRA